MKYFSLVIIAISMFMAGCEDPAANKPRATINNSANSTSNAATNVSSADNSTATIKGDALPITPETSKVEFTGSKVTGKHDGGFKQFTGTIDLVNGKAEESSVSVDVEIASVFTDADGLTEHLKTADFFEVDEFPTSTFKSTKISADAAKGVDTYNVTGELTLRGVTKSISFPATIKVGDADVSVNAEFSVNRKDFGVNYAGMANDLIRDDVVIKLDLKSPRKK